MHQGHNIPWDIISTKFKLVKEDKRFTPPFTGIVSKKNPDTSNKVKHFVNKFIQAIRTFSDTERRKYPDQFTPLPSGELFSDEIREKHPKYLDRRNQRIEYWIERAANSAPLPLQYHSGHGDLADVVKVLLYENQTEALLMLAQHPSIPLHNLHHLHWGHHFGFSRVRESAVRAYLFFNCAEAIGILENGEYTSTPDYNSLLLEVGASMDFPAQQVPHLKFLRECGVLPEDGFWSYGMGKEVAEKSFVHTDYRRLQAYLKSLFVLMYRYDLLMRECGLDPEWETELVQQEPLCQHAKWEYVDGECSLAYV